MLKINPKLARVYVVFAALIGISACIFDSLFVSYLGKIAPGYDPLREPMSILGSETSPFAHQISIWWVVQGVAFILFAIGFIISFSDHRRLVRIASTLIIIYGIGEGIASGVIPIELKDGRLTIQGYIHDLLGGIGVIAVMILPFILCKLFTLEQQKILYWFSLILGVLGILFFIMFTISKILEVDHGVFAFGGCWQRLSSIDYYLCFIIISILMFLNRPLKRA
jgi:hypothetical protein